MKRLIITFIAAAAVLFGAAWGLNGIAEKRAQEEHLCLMQTVLPGSETFILEACDGADEAIRSVHKSDAGYVIETVTQGYADEITMLVGVDKTGTVTGLVVCQAHETLGLGSKILTDHGFLSQFLNESGSFTIGTTDADAFSGATGETESTGDGIPVDGISGATVSSKAVARCVSAAVAYVTGADVNSSATSWGD